MFIVISIKTGKNCEHVHDTRDQAQQCLLKHQSECRKKGVVSDRTVVEIDDLEDVLDIDII